MLQNQAPQLLISIVRRGCGDGVVNIVRDAGAFGSTVLLGRGTTGNNWMRLLCLADVQKEVVLTVAPARVLARVEQALRSAEDLCARSPGFGLVVDVGKFLHLGPENAGLPGRGSQNKMDGELMTNVCEQPIGRVLICVVVNAGLADDLMAAARKAGARGGTILRARGTSRDEDTSFFGITIVPEKELLMIMTPRDQEKSLTDAIEACDCLAQPGVGVLFTLPVDNFFPLGKKANAPDD